MVFGRSTPSMAPFGGKVFIKRKRYGTKGKDLDVKWGPGTYLGVARDVPRGHVVLTDDDHLWCSCSAREVEERPEVFAKGKGPALRPIRTVVDVILLFEDINEATAQAILDDDL